jgi:uncharacterized membrane protein
MLMLNDSQPAPARVRAGWYGLGVVAILAVGIALRALRLDDGLWMDEGISVTFVQEAHSLRALLAALAHTDESERLQQLYVVVLYFWCGLFGDSTVSLRLMSLLPGAASVVLLADAARRLHGAPAGLWAAALASGSAYLIYFSTEIRASALLILLITLFIDGWIADRQSARARLTPLLVCVVSAALLCLGSIYGFLPLAALGLADNRLFCQPRRWWRFWLATGIGCVLVFLALYAPVFLRGDVRSYAGVIHSQGLIQSIAFVLYGITVGQTYGPPLEALHGPDRARLILHDAPALLLYAAVMAALALVMLRGLRRPGAGLLRALAVAFALSLALGAGIGWMQDLNWLPRHAFYLAPLFVLILAGALAEARGWAARGWGAWAAAALVALNLVAVFNMNFREAYALDDYRGVARELRAEDSDAVPVLLSGNLELLRDYYGIHRLIDGRDIGPETLDALLPKMTGDAADVVVVLNRGYYWTRAADKTFPDVYDGTGYTVGEHRHLVYFDTYRLLRK